MIITSIAQPTMYAVAKGVSQWLTLCGSLNVYVYIHVHACVHVHVHVYPDFRGCLYNRVPVYLDVFISGCPDSGLRRRTLVLRICPIIRWSAPLRNVKCGHYKLPHIQCVSNYIYVLLHRGH